VLVETDAGIVGTGETMPRVGAVERVVHDTLAALLLGADVAPEAFWQRAFQALSYHGYAGAELRALSAVDIALWDALGQAAGLPVHRLLGGPCRARVPVYNTCVSYGELADRERFLGDAPSLARELAGEGYAAMKIWPFDAASEASLGQRIEPRALDECTQLFAAAAAAAPGFPVALEGHSCWNLPSATAIAHALEPHRPLWLEDLLPAGDPAAWAQLRASTEVPICGSERLFGRYALSPFLAAGAFDVVKQDICWTGGFTEFAKVAALCDAHELPVAPHNCHGPVGAMATVHASAAIPNLFLMETVRAFERGFFAELADGAPATVDGAIEVPERPGLGVALRPETLARARRLRTDDAGRVAAGWAEGDPWAGGVGDRV